APASAGYPVGGAGRRGGITALYALLGVTALQISTLALLVSSRAQSTDGALRVTYALVLAECVLPLVPHALLPGRSDFVGMLASWFRCLSPIPAVMQVLGEGSIGSQGLVEVSDTVSRYVILAVVASVA